MVEFEDTPDKVVCRFSGKQDTVQCQEIAATVQQRIAEAAKPVVFNLHGVDYVSSAFLRLCLQTAKSVGLDRFEVTDLSPTVKKVFKMAGFDQLLRGA